MCVCNGVCFVDYGLYMLCVACMVFAYVFAVTNAIALLVISRSNKRQESIRTCVLRRFDLSNMDCVWIIYVLCCMYDIGICFFV